MTTEESASLDRTIKKMLPERWQECARRALLENKYSAAMDLLLGFGQALKGADLASRLEYGE
jgi:hypothetical protein